MNDLTKIVISNFVFKKFKKPFFPGGASQLFLSDVFAGGLLIKLGRLATEAELSENFAANLIKLVSKGRHRC